jgi:hypothetical protein
MKTVLFLTLGTFAAIVGFYCLARGSWLMFAGNIIVAVGDVLIALTPKDKPDRV